MTKAKDCCAGDSWMDDPTGLHSLSCPVYLATCEALDRRRGKPPIDWAAFRKCPVCFAETGQPCLSLSGLNAAGPVAVAVEVPHSSRKPRKPLEPPVPVIPGRA